MHVTQPGFQSRKESEVFGGVGVGFFCPTLTPEVQLDHFLHHTHKLGIPIEMVQFLMNFLLKQIILVVYHDLYHS